MKSADRTKLILALVLLAAAGGFAAWHFGLIGGETEAPKEPPPPPAHPVGPRTAPGLKK